MRSPRLQFTVRRMMVAVAIVAGALALVAALTRSPRDPSNASEALSHAIRSMSMRRWTRDKHLEEYDVDVRRCRPDEPVDSQHGQFGVIFKVSFTKRDDRGKATDRVLIWIMRGGYCMEVDHGPDS